MPDYTFEAIATSGQRSQGTVSATSERDAITQLDARGLLPVSIQKVQKQTVTGATGKRVRPKVITVFFSQLALLLRAGVPLLRSLEIARRQKASGTLSEVLADVHAKVADGISLGDALSQHPKAFSELAVSMVRAGQEGGFLEDVLERIASFTEAQEDLKAKVVGALAYPVFLATVGVTVLLVLVTMFIPRFEPIFKRLEEKGELPTLTMALIAFSHFLIDYALIFVGVMAVFLFIFVQWARTSHGRTTLDAFRLRMPMAGKIYLNYALSRFTRILGTLLHNGIPILQALRIAKDSTGNRVLSHAINNAADNVTAGAKLAPPLAACPYFPNDVIEMVAVGEESNQLEKVLLDIANGLEKRTSRELDLFVRLLEPIMLLVMAGVTLIVVAGLLLPVFKMSRAL